MGIAVTTHRPGHPAGKRAGPVVMSYLLQRVLIGVIAVLLPFVLVIVNYVIAHKFQPSMSGYYYTAMRDTFVGSLCAIGVFLVSYDGYDLADRLSPTSPACAPSASRSSRPRRAAPNRRRRGRS